MFGLGLEHAAADLIDNIMWAREESPFSVTGMLAGSEGQDWAGGASTVELDFADWGFDNVSLALFFLSARQALAAAFHCVTARALKST